MDKLKPILFNTDMVRAILDGRKSVTRRVVKSKNHIRNIDNYNGGYQGRYIMTNLLDGIPREFTEMLLPRYRVGDILYIRETCWKGYDNEYHFAADYIYGTKQLCKDIKVIPSIHMPKEAARVFLKVPGVRCERLQGISEAQIKAEGIDTCSHCYHFNGECKDFRATRECKLQSAFIKIWNSTIKKQDLSKYGWQANPWVWVIEFERVNFDG